MGLGYENENNSFDNGSAASEDEDTYKLSLNTQALGPLTTWLTLERSKKDADYPDYTAANAELPWMRKYYAAARDRDRITAMTSIPMSGALSCNVDLSYGKDDYTKSLFGLQDGTERSLTVDFDYEVSRRFSVTPFYTYEELQAKQRSRQWTPGGIGDPYTGYGVIEDANNWVLETTDTTHSVGLGASANLIKEKLDLKLDLMYSQVDGNADFQSPAGIPLVNDLNPFDPASFDQYDDTDLISLGATLEFHPRKNVTWALGYRFEKWDISDFQYDGYSTILTSATGAYNGLLSSDTLYRDYEAHVLYSSLSYRF